MSKRQIPVDQLRIGMYVDELHRPWPGTLFTYQGFPLNSEDQINLVKRLCETVFIDDDRESSIDTQRERLTRELPLRGTTIHPVGRAVEQELTLARDIFVACEASIAKAVESFKVEGNLKPEPLNAAVVDMTRSIERNPDAMMLMSKIRAKGSYELSRAVDVSVLLITFGRFLQLPSARLELLGLAGLLLDIGKVKVRDEILRKKGLLTAEEYEIAKQHVIYSVNMVRDAGLPHEIEDIIVQHHEREDGSGYPQGLRGSQISIDGAVAGLVDSYSALTSARPVRRAGFIVAKQQERTQGLSRRAAERAMFESQTSRQSTTEQPMIPFIAAALPMLMEAAPALIRLFGSSPQSEKNAKAAEAVAEIAKTVTGQPTVEGAVQEIRNNPEVAAQFREKIHLSMGELLGYLVQASESDDKSRDKAAERALMLSKETGGRWLWLLGAIALIVVLASYGITAAVMFWSGSTISDETKALLLGQIVIFGFVTVLGFLFGSNIQNRIRDTKE